MREEEGERMGAEDDRTDTRRRKTTRKENGAVSIEGESRQEEE
jgi:hypothetical protein